MKKVFGWLVSCMPIHFSFWMMFLGCMHFVGFFSYCLHFQQMWLWILLHVWSGVEKQGGDMPLSTLGRGLHSRRWRRRGWRLLLFGFWWWWICVINFYSLAITRILDSNIISHFCGMCIWLEPYFVLNPIKRRMHPWLSDGKYNLFVAFTRFHFTWYDEWLTNSSVFMGKTDWLKLKFQYFALQVWWMYFWLDLVTRNFPILFN